MPSRARVWASLFAIAAACVAWPSARTARAEKLTFVWNAQLGGNASPPPDIDDLLAAARAAHRPVLIDFSADWCAACRILDRETYSSPSVIAEAGRFVTVRVDASRDDATAADLAARFGINELPTVVFTSSRGDVLVSPRIRGVVGARRFVGELRRVN
jgi:thiol:disulfide interchange protein DsbD